MWNVLGLVVQRMTFAVDNNDNVAGKKCKTVEFSLYIYSNYNNVLKGSKHKNRKH